MKTITQLERLKKMNKLIKNEHTGNPQEFAAQLDICQSHLFNLIDDLKIMGAPICYSRKRRTYYYNSSFEIELHYSISFIEDNQVHKIYGSGKNICFTPIFVE